MAEEKAVDAKHPLLSISRKWQLLVLSYSVYFYQPATAKEESIRLMEEIDKVYLKYPFFGTCMMTEVFKEQGYEVNRETYLKAVPVDRHTGYRSKA